MAAWIESKTWKAVDDTCCLGNNDLQMWQITEPHFEENVNLIDAFRDFETEKIGK